MSPFLLIIYILIFTITVIAALILFNGLRTKGSIARALNMSLFLITLPRETSVQDSQKPEKDLISVMEQLFSSFTNLHAKGWNKFIYGEPYLSLEIAVHYAGEEIHFYAAAPRSYDQVFEKQVHGFFPRAEIEKIQDYNIFHKGGGSVGAYFSLKENPILPFKTYKRLEIDPLGEVLTAFSKLQNEGEGAALQILIRPSHNEDFRTQAQKVVKEMQLGANFSEALKKIKKIKKEEKDPNKPPEPQRAATAFESEIMKDIQSKYSKPLFDANIRIAASAENEARANQILDDITNSFAQFNSVDMNSLKSKNLKGRSLKKFLFNFSFRLFNNRQTLVLSSEEIASLFHFPLGTTLAPRVKSLKSKPAEPPPNLPTEGIVIGKNIFRGSENFVRMSDNDRRRHFYLLGQTGTGKTTLMENMMLQDMERGVGIAFIDPHGTGVERILSLVPEPRLEDVIVFNPSDIQRPLGLNMLEFDSKYPEQKTFIVNEMLGIFQKLFLAETMGPMFDQYFRNAMLLLMDDYQNEIPTLVEIPKVLTDQDYRKDKLTRETNPIVKNFWELEAEKASGEAALSNMAPYITSKINGFIANEFLRPILSQKKSAFNFREIMDQKKILLVNLSKGRIGDINANLLGMIIVGKILMSALSRNDVPEDQRQDFYLYIDEFQNFTTDSIASILAESRKYRLNLIIANQFIKQLVDKIKDAVFGNVGSMAVFRVGADDAEFLKNQFEPVFSPQDMINIDNFNCYVKLLINNQTSRPFNIQILPPEPGDLNRGQRVKELARLKYGKSAE